MANVEQQKVDTKSVYMHSLTQSAIEKRGQSDAVRVEETSMLLNMGRAEVSRLTGTLLNGMSSNRPFWTPERRAAGLEVLSAVPLSLVQRDVLFMTYLQAVHNVATLEAAESLVDAGQIIFPYLTNSSVIRSAISETWTTIADINSLPTEQISSRVSEDLDMLGAKEKLLRKVKLEGEIVLIEPLPQAPFTILERRKYVEAWTGQMIYEEMAARLGVSLGTIASDVKALGIQDRANVTVGVEADTSVLSRRDRIILDWNKGKSQKAMAKDLKVSEATMSTEIARLKAEGVIKERPKKKRYKRNRDERNAANAQRIDARRKRVLMQLTGKAITVDLVSLIASNENVGVVTIYSDIRQMRNDGLLHSKKR